MADYGIRTIYGDAVVRDVNALTIADGITRKAEFTSEDYEVFAYNTMYVKSVYAGGIYAIKDRKYGSTSVDLRSTTNPDNCYISTYVFTTGSDPTVSTYYKIVDIVGTDPTGYDQLQAIKNGNYGSGEILFTGSYNDAKNTGNLKYLKNPDESPTTDPDDPENEGPRGLDNADLSPFDETDIFDINSLPDPESFGNMDYGGVVRCYLMTEGQMQNVAAQLFTGGFWTDLKNKFSGLSDPLSMILSCIQVPYVPSGTGNQTFTLGGVRMENVDVGYTLSRYSKKDFGSVFIGEVWGTEKDYSDTSISIYLPYVGVREVDTDIVMNTTCTLRCNIDFWTGDIVYLLHVSNTNSSGKYYRSESVPYRWTGNCGKRIPLGRVDNTGAVLKMVGGIAALGLGVATGGIGLMTAAAAPTAAAVGGSSAVAAASGASMIKAGAVGAGAGAMGLASGFKPTVQTSGGVDGASGYMDYQTAFFIIKRGVPTYPNGWRDRIGATRYQTLDINELTGYTHFADIKLENMGLAVAEEVAELENLVKTEGIIL